AAAIACRHASGLEHCEPTWKVTPYGRSPSSLASAIKSRACPSSVPNLRDSGKVLALSSTRMRTMTDDPGACRASLCSSPSESKANLQSPASYAAATCVDGFTVLL